MKTHSKILPLAIVALCAASIVSWAKSRWDDDANRRKAEYIFIESQNAIGQDLIDEYISLVHRAFTLDSTDVDIAGEWGYVLLNIDTDSASEERGYQYLKNRFLAEPEDYNNSVMFANIARQRLDADDLAMAWEIIDSLFPSYETPPQELANAYLMQYVFGDSSKLQRAIDIYNHLESGTGKTVFLSSRKILAYSMAEDTASIIREIDEVVASAPADSYVALFAGSNYETIKDYPKALEYYDRACQLDSANGQAYMMRANIYKEMGDSSAYDREVFLALKSPNLEPDAKIEILRNYVSMLYEDPQQEGRIRELFQTLETMHPGEADIHNLYFAYLYEIDDIPGAAEQMTYSVALDPSDEGAWNTLVHTYITAEDNEAVIKYSQEAMARFPDNMYYPMMAANAYYHTDSIDRAIDILDHLNLPTDTHPDIAASLIAAKADMLASRGDTARALEEYDLALSYDPTLTMAYNNAAYFMAQTNGDLDKALEYIQKVMRLDDSNPTYLDTYAWVLFKRKEYSLAKHYIDLTIQACEEADEQEGISDGIDSREKKPTTQGDDSGEKSKESELSSEVLEHAGDIYFMNGEPAQALSFWKRALALDPDREILARKVKHKTYFFE